MYHIVYAPGGKVKLPSVWVQKWFCTDYGFVRLFNTGQYLGEEQCSLVHAVQSSHVLVKINTHFLMHKALSTSWLRRWPDVNASNGMEPKSVGTACNGPACLW